MAIENKEIGDIVKKCKILLLDVAGTTTSISFAKNELLPYAANNVKQFLESHWEREDVKEVVTALRKLAVEDKEGSVEGAVDIPGEDASKEEQVEGLVNSVKWQISCDRDAGPLKELQGMIWQQGYDNGDIKGQVFDDVSAALKQWRSVDGQKVYIYSSGSILSQKLLFGKSSAGDLLSDIDGHFDITVGSKRDAASYTKIAEKIGCKTEEILYINDMVKEAEGARSAGLHVALVSREGNEPLPSEATESFPVIHSLGELTVTNKRKQEPQDELPAKVPKTETEDDVKTTTTEATSVEAMDEPMVETPAETPVETPVEAPIEKSAKPPVETPAEKEPEQLEKMEVEESVATTEEPKADDKEKVHLKEVTDSIKAAGALKDEVEPIVEETIEEKESKTEEKQNGKVEAPVTEETPPTEPTVITEIEDVSDKQLGDVAEIIEDLEPVVEEPAAVEDMEELQNVGEVLEKECDEILSKVQDVTNLDNIPLKPLLNPIAEETMETDNADSSDIVDRILDTELELEMKQCTDIDLNTVVEMADSEKSKVVEENGVKDQVSPAESSDVPETKATESNVKVSSVTEEKIDEVSSTETKAEETKAEEAQKLESESKESPAEVSSAIESQPTAESNDGTEQVKSVTDEVKPSVEEAKPVVEEVKPAAEEVTPAVEETKPVVKDVKPAANEVKPAADEVKPTAEEVKPIAEEVKPIAEEAMEEEVKIAQDEAKPSSESKPENDIEPQVNGKATNGDTETANLNGDVSKDEELSARLTVENGKETVNGSNGDSMDTEQGQGDSKVEAEVSDIKVKMVTTDEPRTDPIEQPTEA